MPMRKGRSFLERLAFFEERLAHQCITDRDKSVGWPHFGHFGRKRRLGFGLCLGSANNPLENDSLEDRGLLDGETLTAARVLLALGCLGRRRGSRFRFGRFRVDIYPTAEKRKPDKRPWTLVKVNPELVETTCRCSSYNEDVSEKIYSHQFLYFVSVLVTPLQNILTTTFKYYSDLKTVFSSPQKLILLVVQS